MYLFYHFFHHLGGLPGIEGDVSPIPLNATPFLTDRERDRDRDRDRDHSDERRGGDRGGERGGDRERGSERGGGRYMSFNATIDTPNDRERDRERGRERGRDNKNEKENGSGNNNENENANSPDYNENSNYRSAPNTIYKERNISDRNGGRERQINYTENYENNENNVQSNNTVISKDFGPQNSRKSVNKNYLIQGKVSAEAVDRAVALLSVCTNAYQLLCTYRCREVRAIMQEVQ